MFRSKSTHVLWGMAIKAMETWREYRKSFSREVGDEASDQTNTITKRRGEEEKSGS